MSPAHNRLFFALSPPETARQRIASTAKQLREAHQLGGRLIKAERLHMTLFFLGDVSAQAEARVLKVAGSLECPPFSLRLDTAGCFRNRQIPVWLGPDKPPQALTYLADKLETHLASEATTGSPPFNPHVTIIREADSPLKQLAIEAIEWHVSEFVLIRSILHERPVRYEIIESFRLRGAALPPEPEQTRLF